MQTEIEAPDEGLKIVEDLVRAQCERGGEDITPYIDTEAVRPNSRPRYNKAVKYLEKHGKCKITGVAGQRILAEWT